MTKLDFLKSDYQWCLEQYKRLGYASYMARAMQLEIMINDLLTQSEVLNAA